MRRAAIFLANPLLLAFDGGFARVEASKGQKKNVSLAANPPRIYPISLHFASVRTKQLIDFKRSQLRIPALATRIGTPGALST